MHGRGGGEERKKARLMWTVPTRATEVLSGNGVASLSFSSSSTVNSFSKGSHSDFHGPTSGCTACVAIIRNKELVVANAGDSCCVISRKGQVQFSFLQNPENRISEFCLFPQNLSLRPLKVVS